MVDTITMWIETVMSTEWIYPLVGVLIFGDCFFPVLPTRGSTGSSAICAAAAVRPLLLPASFLQRAYL